MRVKVMVSVAGHGFSFTAGETVDIPRELAEELIRAGYAVRAGVRDARKPTGEPATGKASTARRRSRDVVHNSE